MKRVLLVVIFALIATSAYSQDLLQKGAMALQQRNYSEAINIFSEYISKDTTREEAYYNRGVAYLSVGDFFLSIVDFSKAMDINPKNPDTYNYRGLAFTYIDQLNRAAADFTMAIKLDKKFGEAYSNRGNIYLSAKLLDSAKMDFDKAMKLIPKNPELAMYRARWFYMKKNYKNAISEYTRAMNLGIKSPTLYYNRANAYFKFEKYQEAIKDYTKALEFNPDDVEVLNNRAIAYEKLGSSDLAKFDRDQIQKIKLSLIPDIKNLKMKRIEDKSGSILIDIPESWSAWFSNEDEKDEIIISKDSLNPNEAGMLVGASLTLDRKIPNEFKDSSDAALLAFWEGSQIENGKSYAKYDLFMKKQFVANGWQGQLNHVRVQFVNGGTVYQMYEFVMAKNKKIFYAYFRAPQDFFNHYRELFDNMIKTIELRVKE